MFLISHKHKFIFIHVPRTGGTSIAHSLRPYANFLYKYDVIYNAFAKYIHERPNLHFFQAHAKALNVKSKIKDDTYNDYLKFAVCRNPYDWAVSVYSFTKKCIANNLSNFADLQGVVKECNTFNEFALWLKDNGGGFQKSFVSDEQGNLIVDHLIHFENIQDGFSKVTDKLNIPNTLEHLNASRKNNKFIDQYNSRSKEIVYEAFKEDFDFFNYPKEFPVS